MSELKHLVESTNVRLKEQFRSEIQEEIAYFEDILENEEKLERTGKYLICGMGGSHLQGDVMQNVAPSFDLSVHQDYGLPEWSDEVLRKTLIIASSYSGNTEETVSAFEEAIEKKYPVAVSSIGGKLIELAKEIDKFVEKAQTRKIDLMDLRGGVFTITNIGVIGTTYFTPIPNYPESCILGTGRIEEMPVVKDGKVVARKIMPISFTYDHRILDGAEAARFLNDLKALLEDPNSLSK